MRSEQELWRYLDGELDVERAKAIEAEAPEDEGLRRRLEEMRAIKAEVLAGAPSPPPDFAKRVAALALRRAQAPVIDIADARRFLRRALMAAAILAAVSVTYLAFDWIPSLLEPPQVQAGHPLLMGDK